MKYISLFFVFLCACTSAKQDVKSAVAAQERTSNLSLTSQKTATAVAAAANDPTKNFQNAKVGILYYLDNPNHREAVLKELSAISAHVLYENETLGFISASLSWTALSSLLAKKGSLDLNDPSMYKVELDDINTPDDATAKLTIHRKAAFRRIASGGTLQGTTVDGEVQSAGYGANLDEFRNLTAKKYAVEAKTINGAGITVAVFDGGFNAIRSSVMGDRMQDIIVADDRSWYPVNGAAPAKLPPELSTVAEASSLHFVTVKNPTSVADSKDQKKSDFPAINFAVGKSADGTLKAWIQTSGDRAFEGPYFDFAVAQAKAQSAVIDLYTGKPYVKGNMAGWIKLRENADKSIDLALAGTVAESSNTHGSSNMHMAVGSFGAYLGVAPGANILLVQTWDADHYGNSWIPLAQGIGQAVDKKADVLDLDIFTPGNRFGSDLLEKLICRVTLLTDTVPVMAAHNYGPLPDSVQNLAQSPCVITVGASISKAAQEAGYNGISVLSSRVKEPTDVFTASYSGRGPGYLNTFKPDIISPAYAYTVYGDQFERFGGTSGATPTTSGAVALLKQVASLAKQKLNFTQTKFLLQAGSKAVEHLEDGYGYLDMKATGELLLKHLDASVGSAAFVSALPLQVSAPVITNRFMKNPIDSVLTYSLARFDFDHSNPGNMLFTILNGENWAQLYQAGEKGSSLSAALELPPTLTVLRANANISDADWAALPAGHHIAVIKGVRRELATVYGERAADILIPIVLTKGLQFSRELSIPITAFYQDEVLAFTIDTSGRDAIKLDGEFYCGEKKLASAISLVARTISTGITPNVDINSYAPVNFKGDALSFAVSSSTSEFVFYRYGSNACDQPIKGIIHFSYPDVQFLSGDITSQLQSGKMETIYSSSVQTTPGNTLSLSKLNFLEHLPYKGKQNIPLPVGVHSLSVIAENLPGVLEVYTTKDNTLLLRTNTGNAFFAGDQSGDGREKRASSLEQDIDSVRPDPAAALYAVFTPADDTIRYSVDLAFSKPSTWSNSSDLSTPSNVQISVAYADWSALPVASFDGVSVSYRATLQVLSANQANTLNQSDVLSQRTIEFSLPPIGVTK